MFTKLQVWSALGWIPKGEIQKDVILFNFKFLIQLMNCLVLKLLSSSSKLIYCLVLKLLSSSSKLIYCLVSKLLSSSSKIMEWIKYGEWYSPVTNGLHPGLLRADEEGYGPWSRIQVRENESLLQLHPWFETNRNCNGGNVYLSF